MTPFAAIVGGGGAGLAGATLAHVLTTFAVRLGAEGWLRGPYGPQFVPVALYTGIFYAAIGAAVGRRPQTALGGFLGPLLVIAAPLAVLTRYSGWGMPRGLPSTPQWQLAVLVLYSIGIWGTIAALGAYGSATQRWRGALAAIIGSASAYGVLTLFLRAVPAYANSRWNPTSLIPSPINLMDGLLSGAGLCLALSLDAKLRRNTA
ncbi:MAG: hypothetical protein HYZ74_02710 [Elusimicrobia bacterium]|nr:hypothetical protein [Elusimicrobiota bacterium]